MPGSGVGQLEKSSRRGSKKRTGLGSQKCSQWLQLGPQWKLSVQSRVVAASCVLGVG